MSGSRTRGNLVDRVEMLLDATCLAYADEPQRALLEEATARLHDPLRVAIAGRVKAGKSTLLNALIGDELAPTDEGECTRIVTWYEKGLVYRVTATPVGGEPEPVWFTREGGAIEVDLQNRPSDDFERLTVEWPTPALDRVTFIDTPGMDSISRAVSNRSFSFLTSDEEHTTPSDAVIFLLRHLHTSDVSFLEAFHHNDLFQPSPVNCLAVLSRADEVAVGRLDALESAGQIAARYSREPRLRRLVQRVVPVAGLLAQAAVNLRELEYRRLRTLADADPAELARLTLSVDRFAGSTTTLDLTAIDRRMLLDRFGMFGVRLAVDLLARGEAHSASELAHQLVDFSGVNELREALANQFTLRRDTLKARSALQVVAHVLEHAPNDQSAALRARMDELESGAHEFRELQLLNQIRRGELEFGSGEVAEIERLLGCGGISIAERLGLDADTPEDDISKALNAALERWRHRSENPVSSRVIKDAARALVRTCEGMYLELL